MGESLGAYRTDFVHICDWPSWNGYVIPKAANVRKLMPGPDHTAKRTYRPGLLLQVAVAAWMSIMVMPCAVLAADASSLMEATPVDCHGAHVDGHSADAECCCDPLAITGGEAPKSQRVNFVVALLPVPSYLPVMALWHSVDQLHPPPQSETRTLVYLSTQRLRI